MDSLETQIKKEDVLIQDGSDADFAWPHYLPGNWRPVIQYSKCNQTVNFEDALVKCEVDSDSDKRSGSGSDDNQFRNTKNENSNKLFFTDFNAIKVENGSFWSQPEKRYVAGRNDWRPVISLSNCVTNIHFGDVRVNGKVKTETGKHSGTKAEVNQNRSNNPWIRNVHDTALIDCNDVKEERRSWEPSKHRWVAAPEVLINSQSQVDNSKDEFEKIGFPEKLDSVPNFGEIGLTFEDACGLFNSRDASTVDVKCANEDKIVQCQIQQTDIYVPRDMSAVQGQTVYFLRLPITNRAENTGRPIGISATESFAWNLKVNIPLTENDVTVGNKFKQNDSLKLRTFPDNARKYECDRCCKKFKRKYHLKIHTDTVHGDGPKYECDCCKKTFKHKSYYKLHIGVVHGDYAKYGCNRCSKRFTHKGGLQKHFDFVHGDGPKYQCDRCSKKFLEKYRLKKHIDTVHGEGPKYECDRCTKKFTERYRLTIHINTVHGEGPKFECDRCSKMFSHKGYLKVHNDTVHRNAPKYECDSCNKKFRQRSSLRLHIESVHSDSPKYECDRCSKKFTKESIRKLHIDTVHEGGFRYVCDRCGKRFTRQGYLKIHIDTVHGDHTKYECDRCGKRFSQKYYLRRHFKTVHGGSPMVVIVEV